MICVPTKQECGYCGKQSDSLHRDHVVPRSRGGPDNATNIVLACRECNFAKRDSLATEWLGDECPQRIRDIEDRVNRKLERSFAKRDRKRTPREAKEPNGPYAIYVNEDGSVCYTGLIEHETESTVRVNLADAVMLVGAGLWMLTDELKELPKANCRIFKTMDSFAVTYREMTAARR